MRIIPKALLIPTLFSSLGLLPWLGALQASSRRNAQVFLRQIREFAARDDLDGLFASVQKRYEPLLKPGGPCTSTDCYYEMTISNQPLPWLNRLPHTELTTTFQIHNSSIEVVMLDFRTARQHGSSPIVHVQIDSCAHSCGREFYLNPHGNSTNLWNGIVVFNARANENERDAALSLNLNCFTKIAGCNDIAQLLPSVWKRVSSDAVLSRRHSMSDASWDQPQE